MTAFCTLCGNTEPGDLGATIGICLNAEACRRRQARMREHRQYVAEQIAREIEDIICTPEAACGDLDCRQALADAATARNVGGVTVPDLSLAAALDADSPLPGMPSPSPVPAGGSAEIVEPAAAGWRERAERAEAELEHAKAALAGDHEGIRLWMLDCGELVAKHRARAEAAEARLDAVYEYCQTYRGDEGMTLACEDILAIAGSEEEDAFARQLLAQAKAADDGYKVAAVRAAVYTFLHQYGRSALPTFKVAIDLAVSLRKIIDDLGTEEENHA